MLPDGGFGDGVRAGRHLHPLLPLLPPGVGQEVVVLGGDVVGVGQLHGTDQVFPEHLGERWAKGTVLLSQCRMYVSKCIGLLPCRLARAG